MFEVSKMQIIDRIIQTDDPQKLQEVCSVLDDLAPSQIEQEDIRILFDMLISIFKKVGNIPIPFLTPILSTRAINSLKKCDSNIQTIRDLELSIYFSYPDQFKKVEGVGKRTIMEVKTLIKIVKKMNTKSIKNKNHKQ